MKARAYAKVNLCLDVTGRRNDGYHDLWMVMQSISLHDTVEVSLTDDEEIKLMSDSEEMPLDESNLCYRAARSFFKETGIRKGARIRIEKNIPVSAGLAGGSTDCAAVLRILNKLNDNPFGNRRLLELGNSLGADVPFMMTGGTAICEGTGEIITELRSLKKTYCVLVKPDFGVSTPHVFKEFDKKEKKGFIDHKKVLKAIESNDLEMLSESTGNDLEEVTLNEYPILMEIRKGLKDMGASLSMMSGSGPTVFGLFEDPKKAENAYKKFKDKFSQTYLAKTMGKDETDRDYK